MNQSSSAPPPPALIAVLSAAELNTHFLCDRVQMSHSGGDRAAAAAFLNRSGTSQRAAESMLAPLPGWPENQTLIIDPSERQTRPVAEFRSVKLMLILLLAIARDLIPFASTISVFLFFNYAGMMMKVTVICSRSLYPMWFK